MGGVVEEDTGLYTTLLGWGEGGGREGERGGKGRVGGRREGGRKEGRREGGRGEGEGREGEREDGRREGGREGGGREEERRKYAIPRPQKNLSTNLSDFYLCSEISSINGNVVIYIYMYIHTG